MAVEMSGEVGTLLSGFPPMVVDHLKPLNKDPQSALLMAIAMSGESGAHLSGAPHGANGIAMPQVTVSTDAHNDQHCVAFEGRHAEAE